jgi:predicted Rossmann fold nucleotide-binding protein DprA/Smf involved in DNA uptake
LLPSVEALKAAINGDEPAEDSPLAPAPEAAIIAALEAGPMTTGDLMPAVGLSVSDWMAHLPALEQAGRVWCDDVPSDFGTTRRWHLAARNEVSR